MTTNSEAQPHQSDIGRKPTIHRTNAPAGFPPRWFSVDGITYGVGYGGPRWGWAILGTSGAVFADGYDTLAELRADAKRAVRVVVDS